jgi:hypothetical protein
MKLDKKLICMIFILLISYSDIIIVNAKITSNAYAKIFKNLSDEEYEKRRKEIDEKLESLNYKYDNITLDESYFEDSYDIFTFVISAIMRFFKNPFEDIRELIRNEILQFRTCAQDIILDFKEIKVKILNQKIEKIAKGSVKYLEIAADKLIYKEKDKLKMKEIIAEENPEKACKYYNKIINNNKKYFQDIKEKHEKENIVISDFIDGYAYPIFTSGIAEWLDCLNLLKLTDCHIRKNVMRKMRRKGANFLKDHDRDYRPMLEEIVKENQNIIDENGDKLDYVPIEYFKLNDCSFSNKIGANKGVKLGVAGNIAAAVHLLHTKTQKIISCVADIKVSGAIMGFGKEILELVFVTVLNIINLFSLDIVGKLWKLGLAIFYLYKGFSADTKDESMKYFGDVAGIIGRWITGKFRKIKKLK